MPKKTREEKILARLRRLEQAKQSPEGVAPMPNSTTAEATSSAYNIKNLHKTEKIPEPAKVRTEVVDYSYVKTDLRKTAVLTAAALVIEIGLSLFLGGKSIF
ncbi:MAG: hypothetical protein Q8P13_04800 [bacterium]|nr:hypothetical protein [bacterium]